MITALSNDEAFAGALVFDEFRQEILVTRASALGDQRSLTLPRAWTDADDVRCAEWLQRREINVGPTVVSRSVGAVRARCARASGSRLSQLAALGRRPAAGELDRHLSRRR